MDELVSATLWAGAAPIDAVAEVHGDVPRAGDHLTELERAHGPRSLTLGDGQDGGSGEDAGDRHAQP